MVNLHTKIHQRCSSLSRCSGTWAKDSQHGPAAPEVTRPPPLSPLSTTRKHVHQSEQREATCCPSTGQTHSMAPAEPRQALEQEEPTQRAYNHLLYIYIVHMYSSICMVYMPIFIYSSCPALLRVELEKKNKSFVFSETCTFFFLCSFVLFCFVFFGLPSQIDEENVTWHNQRASRICACGLKEKSEAFRIKHSLRPRVANPKPPGGRSSAFQSLVFWWINPVSYRERWRFRLGQIYHQLKSPLRLLTRTISSPFHHHHHHHQHHVRSRTLSRTQPNPSLPFFLLFFFFVILGQAMKKSWIVMFDNRSFYSILMGDLPTWRHVHILCFSYKNHCDSFY